MNRSSNLNPTIRRTHPRLACWNALLAVLIPLSLTLSGCAIPPPPRPQSTIDTTLTKAAFLEDQRQRRATLHHWQVSGVLQIHVVGADRRMRAHIQGETTRRTKITVLGPMQRVVMALFADTQRIKLVQPAARKVLTVPATAEGLAHLIHVELAPKTLLEAITVVADETVQADAQTPGIWLTSQGERLIVHPETGLIQERIGATQAGDVYRVVYRWDTTEKSSEKQSVTQQKGHQERLQKGIPMPAQVTVFLDSDTPRVTFVPQHWNIPAPPFPRHWFDTATPYRGFTWVRPLGS